MVNIYTLSDPITGEIRYVGKTVSMLNERLSSHIYNTKRNNTRNTAWIKSLLKNGNKPVIELIETISDENWQFWEQHYISLFRSYGFNLNNHTLGGDLDNTGKKWSPELREKHRLSRLNNPNYKWKKGPMSQETKDKISLSMNGRPSGNKGKTFKKTEEMLSKVRGINNGMYGKKHSQESIAKMKESKSKNK